jgi:creatinine amidohydrolase
MGIESYVVTELARRIEKQIDVIVTPTIPVSYSRAWGEFPGTLWVTPATLKAYLLDICNCLIGYGIRYLFFLNGHGPNVPTVEEINQEVATQGVQCAQIDLWRFIGNQSQDLGESQVPLGHSGELATSVMMALEEQLVQKDQMGIASSQPTPTAEFSDVIAYYPSSSATPHAFVGDPSKATGSKGKTILSRCTTRLIEFIQQWTAS